MKTRADAKPPSPDDPAREADFWKARYEEERLRLAKLWAAYQDLEHELRKTKEGVAASPKPAA